MQTTMNQNATAALPGMTYGDPRQTLFESDRIAEVAILMGLFVCLGADKQRGVKLIASTVTADITANGLGIAAYKANKGTANGGSTAQYEIGETVDIVRKGFVWVIAEEVMTAGDPVYVRHTASGGNTVFGKIRNDADTATCSLLVGARVERTSTVTAGPVLISLMGGPVSTF